MPVLTITNTRLIAGIEELAAYFGKDSNEVMQDLVNTELKHIAPTLKAKQKAEQARQAAEQTKRQYEKLIKQSVSENLLKCSTEELTNKDPVEGHFDGVEVKIEKKHWNRVLEHILKILCEKEYIKRDELTNLPLEGSKKGLIQGLEGSQPIKELNISLPSLSALNIGKTIQKIAEYYKIPYSFRVRWRYEKFGDTEKLWLFTNA